MTVEGETSARSRDGDATRVVVLWDGGVCTYLLARDTSATIGRHATCELVVDLPSVSRRHAKLTGGAPPHIEDLGSMHGVKVRGQRIAPGHRVPVIAGDSIELGEAVVVLDVPRTSGTLAASSDPGRPVDLGRVLPRASGETPMRSIDRLVDLVARSDIAALIFGETGAGKTFAAQVIHERSARAKRPLLRIDCANPGDQIHGEAPFAAAAGGTLLLDEVGELPAAAQDLLAATLGKASAQEVRLLSTTRRDLLTSVREGSFRRDLYERINGVTISLPPLRERTEEIPLLAERYLAEACSRAGRPRLVLTVDAMGALRRHPFYGNLRELRKTMERASILAQAQNAVGSEHLIFEAPPKGQSTWAPTATEPVAFSPRPPPAPPPSVMRRPVPSGRLWDESEDVQRERITRALEECEGNQTRAAELLGISRRALIARIEEYGLPRPRKR